MHLPLSKAAIAAINAAPETGIDLVPETGANPGSGTDDWFYDCAVAVFGTKETGQLLHLATGWPRTSCYAMVARDPEQRRKPSSEFLRILFHSPHGRPFHTAFMRGCDWWQEREARRKELLRELAALD